MREGASSAITRVVASSQSVWRAGALGDVIADVRGGFSVNSEDRPADAGELGVLKTGAVLNGRFRPEEHKAVLASETNRVRTSVSAGTIIICRKNSEDVIGASALVKEDCPSLFLSDLLWQITPAENVCLDWLAALVASDRVRGLIRISATGTQASMKNISQDRLLAIPALIPPLPEQRKIAEILRTWDEALEKLTALRAAKARRLAGVGRALLARAADDPATATRPLATLTRIVKGQQLNKLDISDGDYPVWNGGITPSGFHDEWNTEGGTITISDGGNSCGFVNLAHRPFWLGGHCYALQDLSQVVERDFLFHTLKSREPEIMRLRVGSGLPNIQRADLERLPVVVPPRDLQEMIGSALTAGNAEITLLEAEIEALTRQKRGLMQKLLTGEWRVKVEAPVA